MTSVTGLRDLQDKNGSVFAFSPNFSVPRSYNACSCSCTDETIIHSSVELSLAQSWFIPCRTPIFLWTWLLYFFPLLTVELLLQHMTNLHRDRPGISERLISAMELLWLHAKMDYRTACPKSRVLYAHTYMTFFCVFSYSLMNLKSCMFVVCFTLQGSSCNSPPILWWFWTTENFTSMSTFGWRCLKVCGLLHRSVV